MLKTPKHPQVSRSGRSWAVSVTPSSALLLTQTALQTRSRWTPATPSCTLRRTPQRAITIREPWVIVVQQMMPYSIIAIQTIQQVARAERTIRTPPLGMKPPQGLTGSKLCTKRWSDEAARGARGANLHCGGALYSGRVVLPDLLA